MGRLANFFDGVVNAISPVSGNRRLAARLRQDGVRKMLTSGDRKPRYGSGGFASAEHSRDAAS